MKRLVRHPPPWRCGGIKKELLTDDGNRLWWICSDFIGRFPCRRYVGLVGEDLYGIQFTWISRKVEEERDRFRVLHDFLIDLDYGVYSLQFISIDSRKTSIRLKILEGF